MNTKFKKGALTAALTVAVASTGVSAIVSASPYVQDVDSCVATKTVYVDHITWDANTNGVGNDVYADVAGIFHFWQDGSGNTADIDTNGLHLDTTNGRIGASVGINSSLCEPYMDWTNIRGSGVGVNLYGLTPSWYSITWRNSTTQWTFGGSDYDYNGLAVGALQNLVVANMTIGSSGGADGAAIVRSFTVGDTKYIFGEAPATSEVVTPDATMKPSHTGVK